MNARPDCATGAHEKGKRVHICAILRKLNKAWFWATTVHSACAVDGVIINEWNGFSQDSLAIRASSDVIGVRS
jgi:hypothetical protein